MKRYKAVFIDWDDTIGDWSNVARKAHAEMYMMYHLDRWFSTAEEWTNAHAVHNAELWDGYGRGEVTKDFLYVDQFLYPLCRQMGVSEDVAPTWLKELALHLGDEYVRLTNAYCRLLPGADSVVRYLAKRYSLTVVSNGFVECQYHKMEHTGLLPYFRHIVLSEEVGYQKPDPRIYETALSLSGLSSSEVVMVGDSWSSDIHGAQLAGIDQLWIHKDESPVGDGHDATYKVCTIEDVMTLL